MEEYNDKNEMKIENYRADAVDYEDKTEDLEERNDGADEYYSLPEDRRSRTMLWSVLSLALSVLSILLCAFWYVSVVFAVASIVFAIVSGKRFGYFDTMAVIGLILGIVGVTFGAASAVLDLTGVIDALLVKTM